MEKIKTSTEEKEVKRLRQIPAERNDMSKTKPTENEDLLRKEGMTMRVDTREKEPSTGRAAEQKIKEMNQMKLGEAGKIKGSHKEMTTSSVLNRVNNVLNRVLTQENQRVPTMDEDISRVYNVRQLIRLREAMTEQFLCEEQKKKDWR